MMGRRASFALGSVVSSRASPASSIARIDITSELIAVAGLHPSGVSSSKQIRSFSLFFHFGGSSHACAFPLRW